MPRSRISLTFKASQRHTQSSTLLRRCKFLVRRVAGHRSHGAVRAGNGDHQGLVVGVVLVQATVGLYCIHCSDAVWDEAAELSKRPNGAFFGHEEPQNALDEAFDLLATPIAEHKADLVSIRTSARWNEISALFRL